MARRIVCIVFYFVGAACAWAAAPASDSVSPAASFFEEKIRPALAQNCYNCHSARATKLKGALALDTRASALKGGKSGVAIVPGKPDESPLMKAIRRADPDSAMPPDDKDKLSAETIADFEKWIKAGAPFPETSAGNVAALKAWWDTIDAAKLRPADEPIESVIDAYINAKLKAAGVIPANAVSDDNFIRRLTLDLTGRIPTPTEVRQYATSTESDRKSKLVERLMSSPAFVRHLTTELNWMLMDGKDSAFRDYLAKALKENRGWDDIFRDVMSADAKNPATKGCEQFIKARINDQDRMTSDVSVRFFGVNISCAQCHNHPHVPGWTQDHYYGMKSFFSRTYDAGEFVGEKEYGFVSFKPLKSEQTKRAALLFLDGQAIEEPEIAEPNDAGKKAEREALEALKKKKEPPPKPGFSRRAKLVEAGLSPGREGFFARAMVNQTWARLFGQGFVMPIDQMHGQNKPSHPELLIWLARDFVRQKYNLRALIRGLVMSDAYARECEWTGTERPDARLFAVATPRALTPQQMATSLMVASADPDAFAKPKESDANTEKLERDGQSWAALFERPNFDFQVGVDEALAMSNSEKVIKQLLGNDDGRLVKKLLSIKETPLLLRTAYQSVLSREPDSREVELVEKYLQKRPDGIRDVVWSLLASTEFRFNH
ncbi:MAG TPA: DUF1549 domain-containing protein [Planctomycetota bacterium]|nr:DUF1549 domain-containing protein [Planctomycetota bacterium]